jgi:hypothetical protein
MHTALVVLGAGALLLAGCTANEPDPEPDASRLMNLEIGHCSIEPVTYEGRTYELRPDEQFGDGDAKAAKYTGRGEVRAFSPGWLVYLDDSGKKIYMRASNGETPAPGPVKTWCR